MVYISFDMPPWMQRKVLLTNAASGSWSNISITASYTYWSYFTKPLSIIEYIIIWNWKRRSFACTSGCLSANERCFWILSWSPRQVQGPKCKSSLYRHSRPKTDIFWHRLTLPHRLAIWSNRRTVHGCRLLLWLDLEYLWCWVRILDSALFTKDVLSFVDQFKKEWFW